MVLAPVARIWVSFSVKWLALRAGQSAELVFFFKLVRALVARGGFFLLVKWLCAPRGRAGGAGRVLFFRSNGFALRAGQRQSWFFL